MNEMQVCPVELTYHEYDNRFHAQEKVVMEYPGMILIRFFPPKKIKTESLVFTILRCCGPASLSFDYRVYQPKIVTNPITKLEYDFNYTSLIAGLPDPKCFFTEEGKDIFITMEWEFAPGQPLNVSLNFEVEQ